MKEFIVVQFLLGLVAAVVLAVLGAVGWWVYRFLLTDWDTGAFAPPNWGPWRED